MPTLPPRLLIAALAAASAAHAAPTPDRAAPKPACEAFTDQRELRYRQPAATITGHIVAGSVAEPDAGRPDVGQQLVFGTAELASDDDGKRVRVSYAYWNSIDGCGGWEPARGSRFTFDLADDKATDGVLRVMRYGVQLGAR